MLKPKLKSINIVQAIILCMMCSAFTLYLYANSQVNFSPINGTFQNFNPVHRFLSGQVPYEDFTDYLGFGHLYLGSALIYLFGGNFRACILAFNFISSLCSVLISFLIGKAILEEKEKPLLITGFCLMVAGSLIYILNKLLPPPYTNLLKRTINSVIYTSNSARPTRALILPIVIIAFQLGSKIIRNSNHKRAASLLCTGILAGAAFSYGNDFGASCWLCMALMTFIVSLADSRKLSRAFLFTGIEILVSIAGIFAAVEILSAGNFHAWFSSVFGIGNYQAWYYNSSKSYYLYNLDYPFLIIQGTIIAVYTAQIFRHEVNHRNLCRYGIPAFANMVTCCAANEYRLLSGGDLREFASIVVFLTCLFEAIRLFIKYRKQIQKPSHSICCY